MTQLFARIQLASGLYFRALTVVLATLLALVVAGCGAGNGDTGQSGEAGETINITVGASPIDSCIQAYYAQEQGFFEDVGLNVELREVQGGAEALSAVTGGSLDVTCTDVLSPIVAYEQRVEYALVAPASAFSTDFEPATALVVQDNSSIQSAEDLNGKTVAVLFLRNITDTSVKNWVDDNGGDSSTVEFIELPFPQMPGALEQGRVDATLIAEPFLSSAVEGDGRVLANTYASVADEFYITGWWSTRQWVEENPEAASRYAEAMVRATEWRNENPEESAQVLSEKSGIPSEVVNEIARAVYLEDTDPETQEALINPVIQVAADYEVIQQPIDASEFVVRTP